MKTIAFSLCLVLLFSLNGCARRINLEEATLGGATQLSADSIETLLTGNTLHMVSWDKSIEADITFADYKLNATNSVGEKTFGRWTTDDKDHKLCLQFKLWGEGATNCFKIFKDNDHYLLFNNDGTLANTFVPEHEVEYTQADMNTEALALPPPGSSPKTIISAPAVQPLVGIKKSTPQQQLLDTRACPGCNLAGVDLSGTALKGVNLEGANLSGANLQETNLKGANLKGANLYSARLTDAILIKADLENANLAEANLHWADLSKANLRNANMAGAYLVKAYFFRSDLTGANMNGVRSQRTIFEKSIGVPEHLLKETKKSTE